MLTIHGNRRVQFEATLEGISHDHVLVKSVSLVEGEIVYEGTHYLRVGDRISQNYSLELTGTPLTQADVVALMVNKA